MAEREVREIEVGRTGGATLRLDPTSVLDLRSVLAGGADWAPGKAVVDDGDARIFYSLEGFLFTAGPDHRGHPEPLDEGEGRYPLHGSFAGHPAVDVKVMEGGTVCTARVPVRLADGGEAVLHRAWRIDAAGVVHLSDRVENTGTKAFPPMMLYHMNIGTRLFGQETRFTGPMFGEGGLSWDFDGDEVSVRCLPVTNVAEGDGFATVKMGPVPGASNLTLTVGFDVSTLPQLQFWRNRQPGIHVFGIEPCSHRLEKRPVLKAAGEMELLQPGEDRAYALRFSFSAEG